MSATSHFCIHIVYRLCEYYTSIFRKCTLLIINTGIHYTYIGHDVGT